MAIVAHARSVSHERVDSSSAGTWFSKHPWVGRNMHLPANRVGRGNQSEANIHWRLDEPIGGGVLVGQDRHCRPAIHSRTPVQLRRCHHSGQLDHQIRPCAYCHARSHCCGKAALNGFGGENRRALRPLLRVGLSSVSRSQRDKMTRGEANGVVQKILWTW